MKADNKYYTPDISEFHVGFECEFFNRMQNKTWESIICDVDDVSIAYDAYEHGSDEWGDSMEKTFRIKYLDKEGIESLGFNYNKSDEVYVNKNGLVLDQHIDGNISIFDAQYDWVNVIKIKNKSELKKLLQQLGI